MNTVWLFWVMAPHILMPMPVSPAFPDQASCEQALNKADPFLPGKTACWPQPYKFEAGDLVVGPPAPLLFLPALASTSINAALQCVPAFRAGTRGTVPE